MKGEVEDENQAEDEGESEDDFGEEDMKNFIQRPSGDEADDAAEIFDDFGSVAGELVALGGFCAAGEVDDTEDADADKADAEDLCGRDGGATVEEDENEADTEEDNGEKPGGDAEAVAEKGGKEGAEGTGEAEEGKAGDDGDENINHTEKFMLGGFFYFEGGDLHEGLLF